MFPSLITQIPKVHSIVFQFPKKTEIKTPFLPPFFLSPLKNKKTVRFRLASLTLLLPLISPAGRASSAFLEIIKILSLS